MDPMTKAQREAQMIRHLDYLALAVAHVKASIESGTYDPKDVEVRATGIAQDAERLERFGKRHNEMTNAEATAAWVAANAERQARKGA